MSGQDLARDIVIDLQPEEARVRDVGLTVLLDDGTARLRLAVWLTLAALLTLGARGAWRGVGR
jgi:hypothetical protein